ncbi:Glycosyltransferase [Quillaja saponaria]|uniref:Glycosyltransferase n=1 Tax=Quillaja saponaria TaxID=32244 RepID=A0AAD7KVW8_QUISA|nr:Glycosyltransferase [Quillaja saponaria]
MATIVTTPLNEPLITKTILKTKNLAFEINIQTIKFPSVEAGLPAGCENIDSIPSPDMFPNFLKAVAMLQEPFEQILFEYHPDCLVADIFFPWAVDAAAKFDIPRLVFHGTSFFSLCISESLKLYEPEKNVSSDTEQFLIPNLPDEIKLTRMQLPNFGKNDEDKETAKLWKKIKESEMSYEVVVNSFYELEQAYADHYREELGKKAWHIGPVSLCNRDNQEKAQRGKEASITEQECLKWLDSKKLNSVVYVCFGSVANFNDSQLIEIAMGLEASGQQFIWVVKKSKRNEEENEEWLPEGFEKRMAGKGLIIRGWAPQVLILDHEAVGGFVTHCGWNSTLEGISAGLPMVTWPVSAEQFYNEKLVTQILNIGVGVGAKKWARLVGDSIKNEALEKALNRIMVGEEAKEMRNRAQGLAVMARQAVEGGSSYSDLNSLIEELGSRC